MLSVFLGLGLIGLGVLIICFASDKYKGESRVIFWVLLIVSIFCFLNPLFDLACAKRAKLMGVEYHYGFLEGCMVKNGDSYISIDAYRVNEEKRNN